MDFEFLAVYEEDGKHIGIPFICTDYYGRSVLLFSCDSPSQELMDRIGRGFWNVLLEEPHDLPEYQDQFFHLGGGFEVAFGVKDGEPFMEELG